MGGTRTRPQTVLLLNKLDTVEGDAVLPGGSGTEAIQQILALLNAEPGENGAQEAGGSGRSCEFAGAFSSDKVHAVSCVSGEGMDAALACIHACVGKAVGGSAAEAALPLLTRPRHRHHLALCAAGLERFVDDRRTVDMAAEELRVAVRHLGAITGTTSLDPKLFKP